MIYLRTIKSLKSRKKKKKKRKQKSYHRNVVYFKIIDLLSADSAEDSCIDPMKILIVHKQRYCIRQFDIFPADDDDAFRLYDRT